MHTKQVCRLLPRAVVSTAVKADTATAIQFLQGSQTRHVPHKAAALLLDRSKDATPPSSIQALACKKTQQISLVNLDPVTIRKLRKAKNEFGASDRRGSSNAERRARGPKMNLIISPVSDPTKVVFSSLSTEQIKLGSEFDVDAFNPTSKPRELNA